MSAAGRGVVGVSFLTVYRLAELLGRGGVGGAGPAARVHPGGRIGGSARARRGMRVSSRRSRNHPATEEALVAVHRELSDLDPAQLDLLAAQHPRAAEVVRLHRSTKSLLDREWYDEHDLMRVATELVAARERARAGARNCRLFPAAALECARGAACCARCRSGPTSRSSWGARAQPRPTRRSPRAWLGSAPRSTRRGPEIVPIVGTEVWNASDPDDEVRGIVRGVVDAMRGGVPLERMAVLYASDEPYARLLHEHFNLAEIAHNGATTRSMSESVLGRGLLRIFALADTELRA